MNVHIASQQFGTSTRQGPLPLPKVFENFRDRFEKDGFAYVSGVSIRPLVGALIEDWLELATEAGRTAPPDRNAGSEESGRRRYYSNAVLSPRSGPGRRFKLLESYEDEAGQPYTTYLQPAGANREQTAERRFEPLPEPLLSHAGLADLVELYFRLCAGSLFPGAIPDLLKVGLHIISLTPEGARAALSSPNRVHFDGEFVTFIVLLERTNVIRGDSLVADRAYADRHPDEIPSSGQRYRGVLETQFDTLATDDRRTSHYVYPVFARGNGSGRRTVLLIDFTPLSPETSDARLSDEA